ncbi:MAG: hypothetical protein ACKOFK_04640 [Betaproteobacteria bacterium]
MAVWHDGWRQRGQGPAELRGSGALARECLQDKTFYQRHDNTFGRLFESGLAKTLVDRPSPQMLQAADRINAFIRSTITQVSPSSLERIKTSLGEQANDPQAVKAAVDAKVQQRIQDLAKDLKKDPRPWHAEVPEVADFIADPTAAKLDALLGSTSDGWKMIKTYWVAGKYSASGTGLPHQPRPDVPSNWAPASSVSARTGVNPNATTTFESNALSRNQNTVNGISGTTNMLTFMLLHMEREGLLGAGDTAIRHGDALAGDLAFIVMDGGHSIPEAMATYASIMADTRVVRDGVAPSAAERRRVEQERAPILAARQAALDDHVTNYSRMHEDFGSASTQAVVDQAVRDSFESTRQRFDRLAVERSQA